MNINKQHKKKKTRKKKKKGRKKERNRKTVEYCHIVVHATSSQTIQYTTNCPELRMLQLSETNIFNVF